MTAAAVNETPADEPDVLTSAVRGAVLRDLVARYAQHLTSCEPDSKSEWVIGFRAARGVIGDQLAQFVEMIDEMPVP